MSEQLKQAERALDRMSGYLPRIYKDDIEIVRRALTTSQPAQAGEVDERVAFEAWARPHGYDLRRNAVLGHYSSIDTLRAWNGWQARTSLPAPQQATPDHVPGAGIWCRPRLSNQVTR